MLVVQCETGLTGGVLEKNKKGLLDQHSSSEPGQNGETVMTITEAEHTSQKAHLRIGKCYVLVLGRHLRRAVC